MGLFGFFFFPLSLLVLDEMDQLDSKAQDVLYTIFEWPYLPKSRLCLIGKNSTNIPNSPALTSLCLVDRKQCVLKKILVSVLHADHCDVFAGIANALDLTDRILPRLQARPQCRPLLLHFPPYSREELTAIVQDRLVQVNVVCVT